MGFYCGIVVSLMARFSLFNLAGWWSVGLYCGIVQFVWWLDTAPLVLQVGGVWVFTVELYSLFGG